MEMEIKLLINSEGFKNIKKINKNEIKRDLIIKQLGTQEQCKRKKGTLNRETIKKNIRKRNIFLARRCTYRGGASRGAGWIPPMR